MQYEELIDTTEIREKFKSIIEDRRTTINSVFNNPSERALVLEIVKGAVAQSLIFSERILICGVADNVIAHAQGVLEQLRKSPEELAEDADRIVQKHTPSHIPQAMTEDALYDLRSSGDDSDNDDDSGLDSAGSSSQTS